MAIPVIGIDTARHVFQTHGADVYGKAVLRQRLRRSEVPSSFGVFHPIQTPNGGYVPGGSKQSKRRVK